MRKGRFFEIRKGRAGNSDENDEDAAPPVVALPRGITQEAEEADLKKRLGRDELVDVQRRHAAVKLTGAADAPARGGKKTNPVLIALLIVVVLGGAAFAVWYLGLIPGFKR